MTVLSHNVRMNDTKTKMISLNVTHSYQLDIIFLYLYKKFANCMLNNQYLFKIKDSTYIISLMPTSLV